MRFQGTLTRIEHIETPEDIPQISRIVDSGSTHNFIQERIVCFLNLHISPSRQFNVMTGNGEQLTYNAQCLNIPGF